MGACSGSPEFHRQELRGGRAQAPRVGSLRGWDDVAGTDPGLSVSPVKSLQLFPTGQTPASLATPPNLCCLRSMEFAVPSHGGAAKCCALFQPCSQPSAMPAVCSQLQPSEPLSHQSTDSGHTTPHTGWAGVCPLPVLSCE